MGRALRRIPAWAWLAAIVVGSTVFRAILARDLVAPFIMVDELIWAELARGIADDGEATIRGEPNPDYSVVYSLLLSPAYALFDGLPASYAAVKTINAFVMSLAAVPAYFLARRLVTQWLALLGALLAVAVPSLAYTGTVRGVASGCAPSPTSGASSRSTSSRATESGSPSPTWCGRPSRRG